MARNTTIGINGFNFVFFAGLGLDDGVGIPGNTSLALLDDREFKKALKIALELYPDYEQFARATDSYLEYTPEERAVSAGAKKLRQSLIQKMVDEARSGAEYWQGYQNSLKMDSTRKARGGFVYLIKSCETPPKYKIGLSKNPQKRFGSIETASSIPIELTCIIKTDNMQDLEQMLHLRYADKRQRGEWFALADSDVAEICAMKGIE